MNSVTNSSAAAILQDIQVPSCSVYLQGPCSVWSRKINSLGSHGHLTQVFFYMFFSLQVALFAHVSVFPSHGFLHLLYRHSKYIYFSGGNMWLLNCFIYLLKNYFNKHAFFFCGNLRTILHCLISAYIFIDFKLVILSIFNLNGKTSF